MSVQTSQQETTNEANGNSNQRKDRGIPPQGEGGFDQCWYPVALSDEVGKEEVIGREFLDGRVIAFRGASGEASVLSPYCRHIGADLSVGTVVGDDIRCAFHHWKYAADGKCVEIPSGDAIPKTACLFNFPTEERYGLIWAFNGEKALYDLPRFPFEADEIETKTTSVHEHDVDHWSLLSNSVDFSHLRFVHDLEFDSNPEDIEFTDFNIEYDMAFIDPNMGRMDQHIKVFGTNVITLVGEMQGVTTCSMFGGRPVPGGRTSGFVVTGVLKEQMPQEKITEFLTATEGFFIGLIEDDTPIQNSMRFREDHLVSADETLARFFNYLKEYPRAHPSQKEIT